jgi:hypothetical protein
MDTLPENVKEYLAKIKAAADAQAEAERIEQETEQADERQQQDEFVEATAEIFVPEPLRPYLRYGFGNTNKTVQYAVLEVPGLAPVRITVDLRDKQDRYGVHIFYDYLDDDNELGYSYESAESLDDALQIAQTLPDRETMTAKAIERQKEREQERKHADAMATAPLEWAAAATRWFSKEGNLAAATAAALISIAYSLINRE